MTSTIVSWGLTVTLIGAAIYVYRPDLLNRLTSQADTTQSTPLEVPSNPPSKKAKSKKTVAPKVAVVQDTGSASENQTSKKRKIIPGTAEKTATASTSDKKEQKTHQDEDSGITDKEFAQQLAQTQSGATLKVPPKQQPSKKNRRASKLNAANSPDLSEFSTEASSTTGRDGDDDLTPAESPEQKSFNGPASRAGDVSDMLEAPAAKPTTLRLTDVSTETKPRKPANKAFEPVMSKKKRNEQQRKEEQRLAREESDRIHEAKKQEQLRKARMAAGTSNQTKANNFAAKANAWQSGTSNTVKAAPVSEAEPFLDTFEPASLTAAPASGAVHTTSISNANDIKARVGENAAAALTASARREGLTAAQRQQYGNDMPEEDQIKLLKEQEDEDAWESVTAKKPKKKSKQDNESTSGASSPVRNAVTADKTVNPRVNTVKANGTTKKADTDNRFDSIRDKTEGGLQDAEWEA